MLTMVTITIDNNIYVFRLHQASKAINIKRVIPTFSVNGVYSCQLSAVSDQLAMGYGNGDVEVGINIE